MREIKFRAWDEPGKLMVLSGLEFNIDSDGEEYSDYIYLLPSPNRGKWIEFTLLSGGRYTKAEFEGTLMQYTGLKDKNGVEIYEGDIADDDEDRYEVLFDDGCFWARLDGNVLVQLLEIDRDLAVIGNIYENPNLLDVAA